MATQEHSPTFLKPEAKFPFCKGCGHHHYVHALDAALSRLALDPLRVAIVSDIGCIGILDSLFAGTHTFHTTHGRSTAFAVGIETADDVLHDSRLKTVVVIGDGGATIGLLHLVNAAQMNADVTVLVANNFLYGMTGGQSSGFSPLEFVTPTTPGGNIVPPIDLCAIARDAGAGYVARATATDRNLDEVVAEAIAWPGFALVEIVELCTEHATRPNRLDGRSLGERMEKQGHSMGVLVRDRARRPFGDLYRERVIAGARKEGRDDRIERRFRADLRERAGWVLAGTAGERVQFASYLFMRAAISAGLHATQKNDNPVTQGSGFSLSEVCISPEEIGYLGIDEPDVIAVVSGDGLREVRANGTLGRATGRTLVIAEESLPPFEVPGRVVRLPLRATCTPARAATGALRAALSLLRPFEIAAFEEAVASHGGSAAAAHRADFAKIAALLPPAP